MSPPLPSSSSDNLLPLPSVPRRRRGPDDDDGDGLLRNLRENDIRAGQYQRKAQEVSQGQQRGSRALESGDSDNDEKGEDSEYAPSAPPTKRVSRRTQKPRKFVNDDDDDDEDDSNGVDPDAVADDDSPEDDDKSVSPVSVREKRKAGRTENRGKSTSSSPAPPASKKRRLSRMKGTSSDRASKAERGSSLSLSISPAPGKKRSGKVKKGKRKKGVKEEEELGTDDGGLNEFNDVLQQLENEVDAGISEDLGSELSSEQREKKPERLTRRQRALKGEKVKVELAELDSGMGKKSTTPEEWSHDEEYELKRQQKARLRQMINEKRNKERRAAMVDKVLRGVTSKRKKLTMANEARVAQVGSRLNGNEMREGCIRFVSNREGNSVSVPLESEGCVYLEKSVKAVYPRACTRDPRTGKRIFVDT